MAEPITVTEAAEFLRLDISSSPIAEQALVSSIITAARQAVEDFTNRTIVSRTRTLVLDAFPILIKLPNGDVTSVDQIDYVDNDGATQTLTEATSWLLSKNRVTAPFGEVWPVTRAQIGAVTITYTAGEADNANIEKPIIQAMYLLIDNLYDNRSSMIVGTIVSENPTVLNLLMPYRIDMGI